MKAIRLFFLAALTASMATAQTTFELDWFMEVPSASVSITVAPGDTVTWTWTDEVPHSVTSESGSQENFDSGILTGSGTQFSYTFTEVGINDYKCEVHSNMEGTITVEEIISVEDNFRKNISFYPNPVTNRLTIGSLYKIESYTIYDVLGKPVANGKATGNLTTIEMSNLQSGIYFINAISGEMQATFKIAKQ